MVVAFMGKGGSGKTTTATRFARLLVERGLSVLAIDADHNMDLYFNLAPESGDGFPFLGAGAARFSRFVGLLPGETYQRRLARGSVPAFTLLPPDPFTEACSVVVAERLRLMVAGPHTDEVRDGGVCSHAMAAPLKLYIPALHLRPDEAAVLDSTAGTDMVGSGIVNGTDLVFICSEPTIHGTKTARQIAEGLDRDGIPHAFVLTKVVSGAQRAQAEAWLGERVDFVFPFEADLGAKDRDGVLGLMLDHASTLVRSAVPGARSARAVSSARRGVDARSAKA